VQAVESVGTDHGPSEGLEYVGEKEHVRDRDRNGASHVASSSSSSSTTPSHAHNARHRALCRPGSCRRPTTEAARSRPASTRPSRIRKGGNLSRSRRRCDRNV